MQTPAPGQFDQLAAISNPSGAPISTPAPDFGLTGRAVKLVGQDLERNFTGIASGAPFEDKLRNQVAQAIAPGSELASRQGRMENRQKLLERDGIQVPAAQTFGEKATDVGTGLGLFLAKLAAVKGAMGGSAAVAAHPILAEGGAFAGTSAAEGQTPKQQAVSGLMGSAFGTLGQVPTRGVVQGAAKVAAEGATGAAFSKAQGAGPEDEYVQMLLPAAMHAIGHAPGLMGARKGEALRAARGAKTVSELQRIVEDAHGQAPPAPAPPAPGSASPNPEPGTTTTGAPTSSIGTAASGETKRGQEAAPSQVLPTQTENLNATIPSVTEPQGAGRTTPPEQAPQRPGGNDDIQRVINEYHDSDTQTFDEMVNAVEAVAADTNNAPAAAAVAKYREAKKLNREYGDRGDSDQDEAEFLAAMPKPGETAQQQAPSDFSKQAAELVAKANRGEITNAELGAAIAALGKNKSFESPAPAQPGASSRAQPTESLSPPPGEHPPSVSPGASEPNAVAPAPAPAAAQQPTRGAGEGKQPWEMTLGEALGKRDEEVDWIENRDPLTPAGQAHRAAVEQAIATGKPVPPNVLRDYPWLEAERNVKPYANSLRGMSDKQLKAEAKRTGDALNKWAKDTPMLAPDYTIIPRSHAEQVAGHEISERFNAVNNEIDAREGHGPLPPRMTQQQWFERQFAKLPIEAKDRMRAAKDKSLVANIRRQTDASHRKSIERAIAEGKPISPEILADYPDLKPTSPAPTPTRAPPTPTPEVKSDANPALASGAVAPGKEPAQAAPVGTNITARRQQLENDLRKMMTDLEDRTGPDSIAYGKMADASKRKVMRGNAHVIDAAEAIRRAEAAPADHPAKLILHNLKELKKNPPGTKFQEFNTNELEPGARVQVNKKEVLTYEPEEGVIKDGITVPIPEGGATLVGTKKLPPKEAPTFYQAESPEQKGVFGQSEVLNDTGAQQGLQYETEGQKVAGKPLPGTTEQDAKIAKKFEGKTETAGMFAKHREKVETIKGEKVLQMYRDGGNGREFSYDGGETWHSGVHKAYRAAELAGKLKYARRGAFAFPGGPNPAKDVKFADPAVEARYRAAKGMDKPSLLERLTEGASNVAKGFTRHFEHLNVNNPADASLANILRIREARMQAAPGQAKQAMESFVENLDQRNYERFGRMLVLPDILKDIEGGLYAGKDLPFGFKDEAQIKAELTKLQNDSPLPVHEAIAKRQAEQKRLTQEMVNLKLLPKEVLKDDRYYHRQVMEYLNLRENATIGGVGADVKYRTRGFQKSRVGGGDFNTAYEQAEAEYLTHAARQIATAETLKRIETEFDKGPALRKQFGDKWRDNIPPDHTLWSPKAGTQFASMLTVPENVIADVIAGNRVMLPSDVREMFARVPGKQYVIPEHFAEQLDAQPRGEPTIIGKISRSLTTSWKQWKLLNPLRAAQYNLNNMSGDLDAAFAADPLILKGLVRAWRDMSVHNKGTADPAIKAEIKQAIELGVIDSGENLHEIPDISKSGLFRHLSGGSSNPINWYWDRVRGFTTMRENLARLSAFRRAKQLIAAGGTPLWASNPKELAAIRNPSERAAKLSRDLLGDYGNISLAGQTIRERYVPFWSWQEINAPRYVRMFRNAVAEGRTGRMVAATGLKVAAKVAGFTVRATALYAMVHLYNRARFPNEDDGFEDGRLRLILGKEKDGRVIGVRFQGAMSDALAWAGLEDAPGKIGRYRRGEESGKEIATDMAKAPVNKLVNASLPIQKTLAEGATGKNLYPDPFSPRPIRDRAEHMARLVDADPIYRIWNDIPPEDIRSGGGVLDTAGRLAARTVTQSNDPGEQSYNRIRAAAFGWLEKGGRERAGGEPTERSNALYYHKKAKALGNKEQAERWMKRYKELGGSIQGLRQSERMSAPLGMMKEGLQREFEATLNQQQKADLKKAGEWHRKLYVSG